jgi:hypothetical protein
MHRPATLHVAPAIAAPPPQEEERGIERRAPPQAQEGRSETATDHTENRRRHEIQQTLDALETITYKNPPRSARHKVGNALFKLLSATGIFGLAKKDYYGKVKQPSLDKAVNYEKELFVAGRASNQEAVNDVLETVLRYVEDLRTEQGMPEEVTRIAREKLQKKYRDSGALHFESGIQGEGARFNQADDISLTAQHVRMKQGEVYRLPEKLSADERKRFQEKYPYLFLKDGNTAWSKGNFGQLRLAIPLPESDDFAIVKFTYAGSGPFASERWRRGKNELEIFSYVAERLPGFAAFYGTALFADCAILVMPFESLGDAASLLSDIDKLGLPADKKRTMLNRFTKSTMEAVQELHKLGVYHHGLKPDNLLLALDGSVKPRDFNFATRTNTVQRNLLGKIAGLPGYTPPEHDDNTAQTVDLYQLGAMIRWASKGEEIPENFAGISDNDYLRNLRGETLAELSDKFLAVEPTMRPSLEGMLENAACLREDQCMPKDEFVANMIRLQELKKAWREANQPG